MLHKFCSAMVRNNNNNNDDINYNNNNNNNNSSYIHVQISGGFQGGHRAKKIG